MNATLIPDSNLDTATMQAVEIGVWGEGGVHGGWEGGVFRQVL